MKRSVKRALRWVAALVVLAILAAVGAALWWGLTPLGPGPAALGALNSDSQVRVTRAPDGWEFSPAVGASSSGLVFYPGGHVDARSYAPLARDLAARGYLVIVPVMPLSLAVLSPNAADRALASHPSVRTWAIGGHSLGGAMAARYAGLHPDRVKGLVLLAAYPPSNVNLARSGLEVVSVTGTADTVIDRATLEAARSHLPGTTGYLTLEGGNHAQFGDYGPQPGDTANPPLPAMEQVTAAADATAHLLRTISAPATP